MIFKVQQSFHTSEQKQQVLVYNEDRSISWQGDMPKKIKKALGNTLKAYFEGELIKTEISINPDIVYDMEDW